uniref:SHSP domain-containing protein n=1 Tax=Kalanchoe fedtschenkoi TaxID=63787 RepID=A0A7N0U034_KALFE
MNGLVDTLGDDIAATVTHLLNFPDLTPRRVPTDRKSPIASSTIPTDVVELENEYVFYLDVPGLSKADVQVTVEEEQLLVVRSVRKRKREDGEDEGCKILRLERRGRENLQRKFRLPEDADVGKITAKCENGVLKVVVGKNPPPAKGKTVQVKIA